MNIYDFYFRQIVTQSVMDWSFEQAQLADHNLMADAVLTGILDGLDVTQNHVSADLSVDVVQGVAYSDDGVRIFESTPLTNLDCSVDEYGVSTSVGTPGNERWLSVFARFTRDLQEPAIDGNGLQVYTKQYEDCQLVVHQGAEATIGAATKPALIDNAVLLADINLQYGQTTIQTVLHINTDRRQDWLRVSGTTLSDFVHGNPRDAIEELFQIVDTWADAGSPFSFTSTWYNGITVDGVAPPVTSVAEALDAIVYDLSVATSGAAGAELIGASEYIAPSAFVSWPNTDVMTVVETLADDIDGHISGTTPQHPASSVTAEAEDNVVIGVYVDYFDAFPGFYGEVVNSDGLQGEIINTVNSDDRYLAIKIPASDIALWANKGIKRGPIYSEPRDATTLATFQMNQYAGVYPTDVQGMLNWMTKELARKTNGNGGKAVINNDASLFGQHNRIAGQTTVGAVTGGSGAPGASLDRLTNLQNGSSEPTQEWSLPQYFRNGYAGLANIISISKGLDDVTGAELIHAVGSNLPVVGQFAQDNGVIVTSALGLKDVNGDDVASPETTFAITEDRRQLYVLVDLDGTRTNNRLYCYNRPLFSQGHAVCLWQTDILNKSPGSGTYNSSRIVTDGEYTWILFSGESADSASADTPLVKVRNLDGVVVASGKGDTSGVLGSSYYPVGGLTVVSDRLYYTISNGSNGYLVTATLDCGDAGESPRQITSTSYPSRDVVAIGNYIMCPVDPIGTTASIWIYDYATDSSTKYAVQFANVIKPTSSVRLHFDGQLLWVRFVNNDEGGDNDFVLSFHPSELRTGVNDFSGKASYRMQPLSESGAYSAPLGQMLYWAGGLWCVPNSGATELLHVMTAAGLLAR